jgi:hypothetical protein
LSVTARDQGTGKEQKVTITDSTRLERDEIDRMVRDAEQHAEEDRQWRESIESRNQLDSLVLQLERVLVDLGDKVPANEKTRWQEGQNYQPPPGWEFQHGQGPRSFGGGEGFDATGFSDFFESLFGGAFQSRGAAMGGDNPFARQGRPADHEATLRISLEEAC